jgi:hypothetical protein
MNKTHKPLLLVMAGTLVACAGGMAQVDGGTSRAVLPMAQTISGTTAKTKIDRSADTYGVIRRGASRLCFQPGIGWQSLPATSAEAYSGEAAEGKSATRVSLKPSYATPSGTPQVTDKACSDALLKSTVSGRSIGEELGKQTDPVTSNGSMSIRSGIQNGVSANTTSGSASILDLQYLAKGQSTRPLSSRAVTRQSVDSLKAKAYVSRVELRRMLRDAPDLQTRMKLQKVLDGLTKRSRNVESAGHSTSMGKSSDSKKTSVHASLPTSR